MSAFDEALMAFRVLSVVSLVMVQLSLSPDFYRVFKNKKTGEVVILPVVTLGTNVYVLAWFGYASGDIFPLCCAGILGVCFCLVYIGIFYKFSDNRPQLHKILGVALMAIFIVTLYGILGVTGVTGQSLAGVGTTMGAISVVTSIVLYASPLATIRMVIRTKSAASMPFTMLVMNLFMTICWDVYSSMTGELLVLIPNAVGTVLAAIQLTLYAKYPPPKTASPQDPKMEVAHGDSLREASVSLIVATPVNGTQRGNDVEAGKPVNFRAMVSPANRH